ncbi:hypothetical protein ACL2XP_17845 [Sodalis sp. RH21]|uniref:hypothetical protein n=1 Tax=unclassified Sodalis (in: enterobacteria) TaxID=2636512 RepID=UPI0039B36929
MIKDITEGLLEGEKAFQDDGIVYLTITGDDGLFHEGRSEIVTLLADSIIEARKLAKNEDGAAYNDF